MNTVEKRLSSYISSLGSKFPCMCSNRLVAQQYKTPLEVISRYYQGSNNNLQVLDWGCGIGHFSYLLMSYGFDVRAYSYTPTDDLTVVEGVLRDAYGKKWSYFRSDCHDPVSLPYPDESFDLIFSVGVLEHVREGGGNEVASLKEIKRLLKPGGKLFVFHFPNRLSIIEAATRFLNKVKVTKKYSHQYLYRKKDIFRLSKESGMTLKEWGLYNLFPRMSFRSIPPAIANNRWSSLLLNGLEKTLSIPLKDFSQNYYFVVQKE